MARVFVTGASGFIGGALSARLLERGDEVVGLARSDEAAAVVARRGAEVARGDLLDEDSVAAGMEGCALAYHVAGVNTHCPSDPAMLLRVNVQGTEAAVRAAARAGVPRMVFTSSAASVGEPAGTVGHEDTTHRGSYLSVYDRSKHLGEQAAFRAARQLGVELRDAFEFDSCSDAFIARIDEARPTSPPPPGDVAGGSGGTSGSGPSGAAAPGGGTAAPGGGTDTATARRVERGLTIRIRGRLLVGRVSATAGPPCARNIPVLLEHQARAGWRLRVSARTGSDRRFALRLPRTTKPLRVRLPAITRRHAGAPVRCTSASRRIRAMIAE